MMSWSWTTLVFGMFAGAIVGLLAWGRPVFYAVLGGAVSILFMRSGLNACSHCSYDLTGNTSGICPECGKPIEDTP